MSKEIIYSFKDSVATITFNRPDAGNAMTPQMREEFNDLMDKVDTDDSIRALVITGAGRNFCAGGDIKSFRTLLDSGGSLDADEVGSSNYAIRQRACPKPVIAMVNGAAAGAGCSISLGADFRVVTPKSSFIMSFISMALPCDTGGYYNLAKLIGVGRATEMLTTGKRISGEQACEWGLANVLAEEGKLEEETYRFAARLAAGPTKTYGFQKELANRFIYPDLEESIKMEGRLTNLASKTEDFNEAVNAFLEKRVPQFKGK